MIPKECKRLAEVDFPIVAVSKKRFGWQLEAWAVFSNHYHFVAHALGGAKDLRRLLEQIHGETRGLSVQGDRVGAVVSDPAPLTFTEYADGRKTFTVPDDKGSQRILAEFEPDGS